MSKLAQLKKSQSLSDLAKLLGFVPKAVSYILYKVPDADKYREFDIPKKSGGTRTIKAPSQPLRLLQVRLADLITDCMHELMKDNPRLYAASHGFRKGRTIISNANVHRKRRYVFNTDIEDFFGSINFGRVRGLLIKDRAFGLAPDVATVIAQIACHENALPQGSPCSPAISNLVANILDTRLLALAKQARCTYTRYADDLTFSTNEQIFPSEIARDLPGADWEVGLRLLQVIEKSGFRLNLAKTRMSRRRSRQTVTGLVVNRKPNIRQEYYRSVRAMCQSVFDDGHWHRPVSKPDEAPNMTSSLRPLEGMLSHIHFVKARRDRSNKENKDSQFIASKAPIELYRKFLFYKHFVANELPTIVTEGVSDITYLKCAIRARAAHFPSLVRNKSGNMEFKVSFLNASSTSRSILNLGNGASGQNYLINTYENQLKHYRNVPLKNPVIILCDNDEGPKEIFKTAAKKSGKSVALTTTDPFYYLGRNYYLVKVPEGAPTASRDIEELFPISVLSYVLDGKAFDKKKEHGDDTAYGKVVFAEKVVRPNIATIDFSGFDTLLQRIAACLADYAAKAAIGAPPAAAASPAPAAAVGVAAT
jgi:RNA-directed DNA polymerase